MYGIMSNITTTAIFETYFILFYFYPYVTWKRRHVTRNSSWGRANMGVWSRSPSRCRHGRL